MRLEPGLFRLTVLLDDLIDLVSVPAQQKNLSLMAYADRDTPDLLIGDAERIRQILANLVSNAITFTDSGSVVVRVRLEQREGPLAILRFEVTDTGVGLDSEEQVRVFDSFERTELAQHHGIPGTGLGLTISRQLVQLMDGEIGASSDTGGSTFWFTIHAEIAPAPTEEAAIVPVECAGKRLLVVCTEENQVRAITEQLARYGGAVVSASNPRDALEQLISTASTPAAFSLCLVFHDKEKLDGLSFVRAARAHDALESLKICGLVPRINANTQQQFFELGCDALFPLPLKLSSFLSGIAQTICRPQTQGGDRNSPLILAQGFPDFSAHDLDVLVVDDDTTNRKMMTKILESMRIRVQEAASGEEALRTLELFPFDLVLLDYKMPIMNGLEMLRKFHEAPRSRPADVTFVGLTGSVDPGVFEQFESLGAHSMLTKPIRLPDLEAVLNAIVNKSKGTVVKE